MLSTKPAVPEGFEAWMREVDRLTQKKYGLSIHDLPDMLFRDAFDAGQPAEEFFEDEVVAHIHDEFGPDAE